MEFCSSDEKILNKPFQQLRVWEYIENNRSAVIFPEGTRSKTGKPKDLHKQVKNIM
jgi:1-acyl-sn-glycerol-3-phosphate acyltransferase